MPPPPRVLGVILAGGESRRFGAPKALARVGGVAIVERVRRALAEAADDVVLVANEPELFEGAALRVRGDVVPGVGALGGVHTALSWAAEEGFGAALCVACDMPFVPGALLRRLRAAWCEGETCGAVPESHGRRGVEPLCALYAAGALASVTDLVLRGDRRVMALVEACGACVLPLDEVRRFGDPERMFMNVNTVEDYHRAVALHEAEADGG
jgi:molybdopterin-guanine dinucleotide biosynthesis protein A